jgi:hypothetical protein
MGVLDSRSVKKIPRRPVSEIHYSITPILRYSDLFNPPPAFGPFDPRGLGSRSP